MTDRQLQQFELSSEHGMTVSIVDHGAAIRRLYVPTPAGPVNTVLGYQQAGDYLADTNYLGATLGRFAGRIAHGRFELDGTTHQLASGGAPGEHCLHCGPQGFHARRWTVADQDGCRSITLRLVSADGDQGFPGRVDARVNYSLVGGMRLMMTFVATADRPTIVNLSNHAYFNLDGVAGTIGRHHVQIAADHYLPVDSHDIPTGRIDSVEGSDFDLRVEREVGDPGERDRVRGGVYDHTFVITRPRAALARAASVFSRLTGIRLDVHTTQPSVHFYTGDNLAGPFNPRAGLCLEAQGLPNSPNVPAFPSTRLDPGQTYRHQTLLEYSVMSHATAAGPGRRGHVERNESPGA
jgi:aldose 1-epimerase